MNTKVFNILLTIVFMMIGSYVKAGLMIRPIATDSISLTEQQASDQLLVTAKSQINNEGGLLKHKLKRIMKRILKKNNSFGSVFSSSRFRWGALLLLLGIVGALLVNLLSLAQVIGWLSGLVAVVGLVLMIWSLIEYS